MLSRGAALAAVVGIDAEAGAGARDVAPGDDRATGTATATAAATGVMTDGDANIVVTLLGAIVLADGTAAATVTGATADRATGATVTGAAGTDVDAVNA